MTDIASGLSILHVIVRAGPTNSQFNEHCLPVADTRRITVCSLFPADVTPPPSIRLVEGNGTVRGCFDALDRALSGGTYDVVHVHAPASGIVTALTYLRRHRSREDLVLTLHNSWQNFRLRSRFFLRFLLAFFPTVVVCGRAAHESMPRGLRMRHADKLAVVQNGVDLDRIDSAIGSDGGNHRPQVPRREGTGRTVLSVNRLIPLKDPVSVLSTFLRVRGKNDRLVLVGEGPLRKRLESRARAATPRADVEFTGLISRDAVFRQMRDADLFVTASRGEGLPVAVLEAMAARCPVVASDIPPHREVASLAPGLRLVRLDDADGLQRAVSRSLALPDDERREIGEQMRACVEEHFSVEAMNQSYGRLYARIAARRAGGALDRETPFLSRRRRRTGTLLAFTALGALGGFLFVEYQPPVFKGETTLMVGNPVGAATNEDALNASAALAVTYADLARRAIVLEPVAERGFADDWRALREKVHTQTGDKNPQLVQVSAYAGTAAEADALATALAEELVGLAAEGSSSPRQRFLDLQLESLADDIRQQRVVMNRVTAKVAGARPVARPVLRERANEVRASLSDLQRLYAELSQLGTPTVADLSVVDEAWASPSPLRPTPVALVLAGAMLGFGLVAAGVQLFGRGPRTPEPPTDEERTGQVRPMRADTWAGAERSRTRSPSREAMG